MRRPGGARRSAPARGAAWWGRTGQRQQLHATLRRAVSERWPDRPAPCSSGWPPTGSGSSASTTPTLWRWWRCCVPGRALVRGVGSAQPKWASWTGAAVRRPSWSACCFGIGEPGPVSVSAPPWSGGCAAVYSAERSGVDLLTDLGPTVEVGEPGGESLAHGAGAHGTERRQRGGWAQATAANPDRSRVIGKKSGRISGAPRGARPRVSGSRRAAARRPGARHLCVGRSVDRAQYQPHNAHDSSPDPPEESCLHGQLGSVRDRIPPVRLGGAPGTGTRPTALLRTTLPTYRHGLILSLPPDRPYTPALPDRPSSALRVKKARPGVLPPGARSSLIRTGAPVRRAARPARNGKPPAWTQFAA